MMNEKWIEILKAGSYPQGNVTLEDIKLMAQHYNPDLQQAPFISKHRQFNDKGELINNEPALGWVKAVRISGSSLYVLPEDESSLKDIYDGKTFKYASAEIENIKINGRDTPYLGAIAATNFPASKIQQIKFNDKIEVRVYTYKLNFIKEEELKMDKEKFIQLCETLGLSETATQDDIIKKFTEMKEKTKDNEVLSGVINQLTEIIGLIKIEKSKPADTIQTTIKDPEVSAAITKLTETVNKVLTKFDQADEDGASQYFEQAIKDRRVLPSQKDDLVGDAKKPGIFYKNADGLKKFVEKLPVLSLSPQIILPKDNNQKPVIYSKLLKDPKLFNEMKKNNPELFERLRNEWQQDPNAQKEEIKTS